MIAKICEIGKRSKTIAEKQNNNHVLETTLYNVMAFSLFFRKFVFF